MSITVDLSPDELGQIERFTEMQNEGEAVARAAREFLRMTQLRELKGISGKVDYCDAAEELGATELREQRPDSA